MFQFGLRSRQNMWLLRSNHGDQNTFVPWHWQAVFLEQRWHSKKPRCSFSGFKSLAMVVIKHTHTHTHMHSLRQIDYKAFDIPVAGSKLSVSLVCLASLFLKPELQEKGGCSEKQKHTDPMEESKALIRHLASPNEPETSTEGSIRPDHPSIQRPLPSQTISEQNFPKVLD